MYNNLFKILPGVLGLGRGGKPYSAHLGAKLGCQGALGRQVGLPRRTWTPSWAAQAHLGAKLGCQGALGRYFDFQCGLQVPPQSAPDPQICSTVQHFSRFFKNCFYCFSNALGLLSGGSFGPLGRPSWHSKAPLGSRWALPGRLGSALGRLPGALRARLGPPSGS